MYRLRDWFSQEQPIANTHAIGSQGRGMTSSRIAYINQNYPRINHLYYRYGEMECHRIIGIEVLDIPEDDKQLLTGISLISDHDADFGENLLDLTMTTQHGTLSFATQVSRFGGNV